MNLGLLDTKTCFHPTPLLHSTGTRESINSYSLIHSSIPSPLALPHLPLPPRHCPPPRATSGKGGEDSKDMTLCTPAVPRVQPHHWEEEEDESGYMGGFGPQAPLLPVTSGHCTDRGELTVNCWVNDYKPARTAPAPNILTAWGWPREGAGLGRARLSPQGASSLLPLPLNTPQHSHPSGR